MNENKKIFYKGAKAWSLRCVKFLQPSNIPEKTTNINVVASLPKGTEIVTMC
jgi:hypothetical protein